MSVQHETDRKFRPRPRAVVIGRWGDDTALLRMPDGTAIEAPVPEGLRDRFEVGDEAELEFVGDRLVGWDLAPLG